MNRKRPGPSIDGKRADVRDSRSRQTSRAADRLQVLEALQAAHWNRTQAARFLNISYSSLLGKLRRYRADEHPVGNEE